jgi:hypothetical protein
LRSGKSAGLWLVTALIVVGASSVSAHRRDEYLQAARLAVAPGRVELQLDLTPGIAIADDVIARIDRDRDGVLSPQERGDYVSAVMEGIEVRLDGIAVAVPAPVVQFPDIDAFQRGEGTIRLSSSVTLPRIQNGAHALTFRNGHQPEGSVYLANALVPDGDRISIEGQRRDPDQRDLTIDYIVHARTPVSMQIWFAICIGGVALLGVLLRALGSPVTIEPRVRSSVG